MKKVVYIAALVMVVASCQKEDIRPTAPATTTTIPVQLKSGTIPTPEPQTGELDASGDTETTTGTTPPDSGDGEITDPMRKKDKKEGKQ